VASRIEGAHVHSLSLPELMLLLATVLVVFAIFRPDVR
jgi:hypothetical protein